MKPRLHLFAIFFLLSPLVAHANPTQYGDSGLLSQPTAETLNSGNICVALWSNFSSGEDQDATVVPFSITLGLGSFLEMYGSYPNLLFNGDEDASGRGYANMGMKIRVLGSRSSMFKLAIDGQGRRMVSDDPNFDGLTDYAGRVIASFKPGRFGIHANAGYLSVEDPKNIGLELENQVVYGGGIELFPIPRLRLIAEMEAASERLKGADDLREASIGFQYYISPHLTLNLGAGMGLTDASPDWRILAGFSACQGIGSYTKPVPRIIEPVAEEAKEPAAPAKVIKVRTLTPLIPKAAPAAPVPTSRFEVPVEPGSEQAVVSQAEKLPMPAGEEVAALPVAPISPAPADISELQPAAALPVEEPMQAAASEEPVTMVVYRKFRLPEFSFEQNAYNFSEEGKKAIGEIVEELRRDEKPFIIKIEGHTDSIGSEGYNQELSYRRAVAVATYMAVYTGIDSARIFVNGYGESKPIADNLTPEGRNQNRRFEILVLLPKEGAF